MATKETINKPSSSIYAEIDGQDWCLTCLTHPILKELEQRTDLSPEVQAKVQQALEIKKNRLAKWQKN